MITPPPLITDQLHLLPSHPALATRVANYFTRNRDFLAPFEPPRPEDFFTPVFQRRSLEGDKSLAAAGRGVRYWLCLEPRGALIGSIALNEIVRGSFQSAFVGYRLSETHQGQGYMTQALTALARYAFDTLKLHRLEANVMPRNAPSIRVCEKAGFAREGLAKQYLYINGVWEDHVHMVLLNHDLQAPCL